MQVGNNWIYCGLAQVVLESLRMASVISFPFREAVTDVEYKGKRNIYYICKNWNSIQHRTFFLGVKLSTIHAKWQKYFWALMLKTTNWKMWSHLNKWLTQEFETGFLIPKGWKAMPLFRNIHHNSEFFPEPQKFNPSRFEVCRSTEQSI